MKKTFSFFMINNFFRILTFLISAFSFSAQAMKTSSSESSDSSDSESSYRSSDSGKSIVVRVSVSEYEIKSCFKKNKTENKKAVSFNNQNEFFFYDKQEDRQEKITSFRSEKNRMEEHIPEDQPIQTLHFHPSPNEPFFSLKSSLILNQKREGNIPTKDAASDVKNVSDTSDTSITGKQDVREKELSEVRKNLNQDCFQYLNVEGKNEEEICTPQNGVKESSEKRDFLISFFEESPVRNPLENQKVSSFKETEALFSIEVSSRKEDDHTQQIRQSASPLSGVQLMESPNLEIRQIFSENRETHIMHRTDRLQRFYTEFYNWILSPEGLDTIKKALPFFAVASALYYATAYYFNR